jgi:hypothetical protein
MFGFAFAMVPLYEVLCEVTGLNGKTNSTAAQMAEMDVDEERVHHRAVRHPRRPGNAVGFSVRKCAASKFIRVR